MSIILSSLQTIGLVAGAFIGYNHGFIYKTNLCNNVLLKKYDDLYMNPNFNESTMSEKAFYNCIGLFSGLIVGYYVYPIMIPSMIYKIYEIYPDEINQLQAKLGLK